MAAIEDFLATLRRARFGIALFGLLVSCAALAAYNAADTSFRAADDRAERLLRWQASLEASIGYGGMIHNFKNYVLRGADAYRRSALRDYASAMVALQAIQNELGPSAALRTIRATLDEYRNQIEVAQAAIRRGARPQEIDLLVKVDDSQPVLALRDLLGAAVREAQDRRAVLMRKRLAVIVSVVVAVAANVLLLGVVAGCRRRSGGAAAL